MVILAAGRGGPKAPAGHALGTWSDGVVTLVAADVPLRADSSGGSEARARGGGEGQGAPAEQAFSTWSDGVATFVAAGVPLGTESSGGSEALARGGRGGLGAPAEQASKTWPDGVVTFVTAVVPPGPGSSGGSEAEPRGGRGGGDPPAEQALAVWSDGAADSPAADVPPSPDSSGGSEELVHFTRREREWPRRAGEAAAPARRQEAPRRPRRSRRRAPLAACRIGEATNPGPRVAPDTLCDVTPVRVLLDAFEELQEDAAEEEVLPLAHPTPVAQRRPRKWKAKAGDVCTVCAVPQREGKWGYACSACYWVSCGAACKKRDFDTHLCEKPRLSAAAARAANAPPPAAVAPVQTAEAPPDLDELL